MNINRRNFLKSTAAGAAGTALAGGVLIGGAHADANAATTSGPVTDASYPFHGVHQSGVLTPGPSGKQAFTTVASFNAMASDKAELADLMRTITTRARFLATGGTPADLGVSQPPADSDVLGPVIPADGLTATLFGRLDPVRRPVRPRAGQAEQADADDRVPERRARTRLARRRPAAPVLREPPGHDPPRDQGHHQAHPRRYAAGMEDGGLQLAAPPLGHLAQPARLQGRHRQPDRRARERPGSGWTTRPSRPGRPTGRTWCSG